MRASPEASVQISSCYCQVARAQIVFFTLKRKNRGVSNILKELNNNAFTSTISAMRFVQGILIGFTCFFPNIAGWLLEGRSRSGVGFKWPTATEYANEQSPRPVEV